MVLINYECVDCGILTPTSVPRDLPYDRRYKWGTKRIDITTSLCVGISTTRISIAKSRHPTGITAHLGHAAALANLKENMVKMKHAALLPQSTVQGFQRYARSRCLCLAYGTASLSAARISVEESLEGAERAVWFVWRGCSFLGVGEVRGAHQGKQNRIKKKCPPASALPRRACTYLGPPTPPIYTRI